MRIDLSEKKLPKNIKADYIIHAATYGQPKKFLEFPKETVFLNTKVLFYLLELAKASKATLLYLSSAEIYGQADINNIPTKESYYGFVNTLSERAIYAESKRIAESICYLYSKAVDIKIARLLIAYGPGVKYDDQRVISEFIKRTQETGTLTMMDQGTAVRIFCFVSDTIEMLMNILINSKDTVYNVSGNQTVTIGELAQKIARINSAVVKSPEKLLKISGTPNNSALSNKKYVNEFSKKSFIRIEEGLKITSDWFKSLKKHEKK
jgi:dTDP-glucose 4,6-dehydratase/UDP-glucuronate decarboxylase